MYVCMYVSKYVCIDILFTMESGLANRGSQYYIYIYIYDICVYIYVFSFLANKAQLWLFKHIWLLTAHDSLVSILLE